MKMHKTGMSGKVLMLCGLLATLLVSCGQDEYYIDGGLANPNFDGSMLEYLESKPVEFDTIAQIIKLAGLEETFQNDEITFFAPSDMEVKELIGYVGPGGYGLNNSLYHQGKDTVKVLADVDSLIWKKYLSRHIFRGSNQLKDYPQIDFNLRQIYPGENYYSLNNTVLNIGVIYHDANGVKYVGYRQLVISYIPDVSNPQDNWYVVKVSSSDIKPLNGVVHTLVKVTEVNTPFREAAFGFSDFEFINDVARTR